MGIETLLLVGLTAAKTASELENAEDQATAVAREGALKATERAKRTAIQASKQRTSFLSSGFTLTGTPMSVISETIKTGQADVAQIGQNYQTQAGNIMSKARSKAIGNFASLAGSAPISSSIQGFGNFATDQTAFALNRMGYGETAYDMLDTEI